MIALISQRDFTFPKLGKVSGLEQNYIRYFESKKFELVPVPNGTVHPSHYFETMKISHLILTGGNDISPELYGGESTASSDCSIERDQTEKMLLTLAIQHKIPVLGICRGMQFINVYFGGSLIQDITKVTNEHSSAERRHEITIDEPRLRDACGMNKCMTNSYHNQGLDKLHLASPLDVFSRSADGIILEGIYHKTLPIAGIEWHPEREAAENPLDELILNSFAKKELYWSL